MKKLLIILTIAILMLSGCTINNASGNQDNMQADMNGDANSIIDLANENIIINFEKIIYAKDSFSNCGFTHFIIFESGDYKFEAIGDNNLVWDIYLLKEEWEDADRFIPQASMLALSTDGTLHIDEGRYVYIQCPHNDFTADAPLEGDYLRISK